MIQQLRIERILWNVCLSSHGTVEGVFDLMSLVLGVPQLRRGVNQFPGDEVLRLLIPALLEEECGVDMTAVGAAPTIASARLSPRNQNQQPDQQLRHGCDLS